MERNMFSLQDISGESPYGAKSNIKQGPGRTPKPTLPRRGRATAAEAKQRARLNEMRLTALYHLSHMDEAPEEEVMRFVVESITKLTDSALGYLFIASRASAEKGRIVWSQGHYDFLRPDELPEDRLPPIQYNYWRDTTGRSTCRTMNNGDGVHPILTSFGGKLKIMRYMRSPAMEGSHLACVAAVCNKPNEYDEADLQQLELFLNGVWLILRRREYVQQLKKAKEISERANRIKDEFLANISHELRTPLNGMLSTIELLSLSPLSEEQREYARAASYSGQALLRIISDILDFSRMASGKMELRLAPFSIAATIRSCLDLFALEAAQKGLSLTAEIADDLPRELLGDEARLRQVIFNLVGNALKFTDRGSITVHCSLLPHTRDGKTWVYMAVEDSGIGIAEADMDVLFDPFVQLPNAFARKFPGTGLGLGIVKNLMQLMGGTLAVETQEGNGTIMHFALGFMRPAVWQGVAEPVRGAASKVLPLPLDVLVAEDDSVSQFALRSLLQRFGHRVVCVENGRQALEALLLHPFHCLITDIRMPVMDGLELVRCIRSNRVGGITPGEAVRKLVAEVFPDLKEGGCSIPVALPVAALTAHAMAGDKEYFLSQGIDLYLSKPVARKDLLRMLQQVTTTAA